MPGEDKNQTWDENGNLVEETVLPVSDDELLSGELQAECNSYHILALQAYRNWDRLTPPQQSQVLKFLLGFYLVAGQRLGYFVL